MVQFWPGSSYPQYRVRLSSSLWFTTTRHLLVVVSFLLLLVLVLSNIMRQQFCSNKMVSYLLTYSWRWFGSRTSDPIIRRAIHVISASRGPVSEVWGDNQVVRCVIGWEAAYEADFTIGMSGLGLKHDLCQDCDCNVFLATNLWTEWAIPVFLRTQAWKSKFSSKRRMWNGARRWLDEWIASSSWLQWMLTRQFWI